MMSSQSLTVRRKPFDEMIADCVARLPDEACGVLVGRSFAGRTTVEYAKPLDNVWPLAAERTTRYAVDPLQQLRAEREAESAGLAVVGYYHSHPTGEPVPSEVDRGLAWPGYCYVIVGLSPRPHWRAWVLEGDAFVEILTKSADPIATATDDPTL